jgi:hypothetical protein
MSTQAQVRALTVGGRCYPLFLPDLRDPRLHVAAVIVTIHVLGQLGLHFVVSIPQILAAILTCAVLEIAINFKQKQAIVWPASAMLTGSGVALILRVVGTPADDHWSTFAVGAFAAVAGISLLSKYAIRYRGSQVFNPSNIGLVVAFILLGDSRVEPLDFWWAPLSVWLFIAYAVILVGGFLITRRLGLISLALTFWVTLALGLGVLAASGHCITANWAFAPVCGTDFWRVIITSPELLIFLLFMITDPRTVPAGRVSRLGFGALVAVVGTLALAPQTTEFGAKVGLLSGLTLACLARPLLEGFLPRPDSVEDNPRRYFVNLFGLTSASTSLRPTRLAVSVIGVTAIVVGIVVTGIPARGVPQSESDIAMADTDIARMDPATFPAFSVDSAVTDWDPALTGSAMREILLSSAQNLEIENEALLRADPNLLTQVDHGDRLVEMQSRLSSALASGATHVDHYQPDSVSVSLLRPFGRQDGLSLGLKSSGLVTSETYDTSGRLLERTTSPFTLTFVVRRATGARWLTVAVLPPEGLGLRDQDSNLEPTG